MPAVAKAMAGEARLVKLFLGKRIASAEARPGLGGGAFHGIMSCQVSARRSFSEGGRRWSWRDSNPRPEKVIYEFSTCLVFRWLSGQDR